MKKLLFIEDLYEFYFSKYKRSTHFSSKKSGYPLVVQVRGSLCFDDDSNEKAGLLSVHLQSCHTNLNDNGSFISDENMEKSLQTKITEKLNLKMFPLNIEKLKTIPQKM